VEESFTGGDFGGERIAIRGRAAFDDVADVDFISRDAVSLEIFGQQLSGGSDKGDALLVFICAGGLADKDESCVRVASAWYCLGSSAAQGAVSTGFHRTVKLLKRACFSCRSFAKGRRRCSV